MIARLRPDAHGLHDMLANVTDDDPVVTGEPTFRNFVAVTLLALLASRPHAHAHRHRRRDKG